MTVDSNADVGCSAEVLLVTPRYYPDSGGIETHVQEVSRRLAIRGIRVAVLTSDRSRELPSTFADDGFTVERVPAWPRRRDYYFAPGIWRRVVDGPESIIHCQGIHTLVPVIAMLSAVRSRKPFVVTFHTGGHSSRLRNSLRRFQFKLLAPLVNRALALVAVSRFERDWFQQILGAPDEKMYVIRNGGSLPSVTAAPTDGEVLVSVGRLEQYKGHHRLIEALPQIRVIRPSARVVILGSGPAESELREQALRLGVSDAVEITSIPSEDRTAMAQRIAGAAIMVLLSDFESHPIAVMEALAVGRPVLVRRNSGMSELVDAGLVNGIDDDSDTNAVVAAIVAMLAAPGRSADIGEALPTWDTCTDGLVEIYRSVDERVRAR